MPKVTAHCDALDSPTEVNEPSQGTNDSEITPFDYWSLVDVPGSPLLRRLFEALEIECEILIPYLDLASSNHTITLLPTPETHSGVEASNDVDHEEWYDFSTGTGSLDLASYSWEVFHRSEMNPTGSNP